MLLLTKNSTNNLGLKKLNALPPIRQPDIEKKNLPPFDETTSNCNGT